MDVRMPVLDGLAATRQILVGATPGEPTSGHHAHHLRPGRIRVRRAARRSQRVPPEALVRAGTNSPPQYGWSRREMRCWLPRSRVAWSSDSPGCPQPCPPDLTAAGPSHPARDRRTPAGGAGGQSNREIAATLVLARADGEDPREPDPDQAGPSGSSAGCRLRLRVRARHAARTRERAVAPGSELDRAAGETLARRTNRHSDDHAECGRDGWLRRRAAR